MLQHPSEEAPKETLGAAKWYRGVEGPIQPLGKEDTVIPEFPGGMPSSLSLQGCEWGYQVRGTQVAGQCSG